MRGSADGMIKTLALFALLPMAAAATQTPSVAPEALSQDEFKEGSCSTWITQVHERKREPIYAEWLMGFQSGFALQASIDGRVPSDEEEYVYWFYARLEKYCASHPSTGVPTAALEVLQEFRRQKTAHHPVHTPSRRAASRR